MLTLLFLDSTDMTRSQLMEAVEKHRDTTRPEDYHPPNLKRILPYLTAADDTADVASTVANIRIQEEEREEFDPELHAKKMRRVLRTRNRMKRRSLSTMRVMMEGTGGKVQQIIMHMQCDLAEISHDPLLPLQTH